MTTERKHIQKETQLQTTLVHRAIITNGELILLLKRTKADHYCPNKWELPGGKFTQYENPQEALQREVKEETNLEIKITKAYQTVHAHTHRSGKYAGFTYIEMASLCKLTENANLKQVIPRT